MTTLHQTFIPPDLYETTVRDNHILRIVLFQDGRNMPKEVRFEDLAKNVQEKIINGILGKEKE